MESPEHDPSPQGQKAGLKGFLAEGDLGFEVWGLEFWVQGLGELARVSLVGVLILLIGHEPSRLQEKNGFLKRRATSGECLQLWRESLHRSGTYPYHRLKNFAHTRKWRCIQVVQKG